MATAFSIAVRSMPARAECSLNRVRGASKREAQAELHLTGTPGAEDAPDVGAANNTVRQIEVRPVEQIEISQLQMQRESSYQGTSGRDDQ
jgi:hypothetical protein